MTDPVLAYIFQGQLHLERDGGGQVVESAFGRSLRDRAAQIYNRHAWKTQGRGGQSLSRALRMPDMADPGEFRIAVTSVARGWQAGELMYTLETDEISGVFVRDSEGVEKRLFHTADFRARHPDPSPDGSAIALSVSHRNGMANLAVLKPDGSDLNEVTDGESMDEAPRWVPGAGRRLVFQSAGMARDLRGRYSHMGPSCVQQLDLDSGEMTCLAQDAGFDFLWPRMAPDGALYYIRRPYNNPIKKPNPAAVAGQTMLMPFRILFGIFKFFELMAMARAGRLPQPEKDAPETSGKTPASWLLMRQPAGGGTAETVAEAARSFDLANNGSLLYSDGLDAYRIPAGGGSPQKVLAGAQIDLIAAL